MRRATYHTAFQQLLVFDLELREEVRRLESLHGRVEAIIDAFIADEEEDEK